MKMKATRTELNSADLASVRKWLKEAIENWLATNDAKSFRPYQSLYRARMEPEEVLLKIYNLLDVERSPDQTQTNQSIFRHALSELLTEPEVLERKPLVFENLLKLGKQLGCAELIDALTINAHRRSLKTVETVDPVSQNTVQLDLLRMSVSAVVEGRFASASTAQFFRILVANSGPDYPHFPLIFEKLLEAEPDKAIALTMDYANEIQDYLLRRMEYGEAEFGFAERKIKASIDRFVSTRTFDGLTADSQMKFAKSPVGWLFDTSALPPKSQPASINVDPESLRQEVRASLEQAPWNMTKSSFESKLKATRDRVRSPRIIEDEVVAAKESALIDD